MENFFGPMCQQKYWVQICNYWEFAAGIPFIKGNIQGKIDPKATC